MNQTEDEIRDWKEQVRLNTLVYEYAQEKLGASAFGPDEEACDELNAKVKSHYLRLAEESRELSELFKRMIEERKNAPKLTHQGSVNNPREQLSEIRRRVGGSSAGERGADR